MQVSAAGAGRSCHGCTTLRNLEPWRTRQWLVLATVLGAHAPQLRTVADLRVRPPLARRQAVQERVHQRNFGALVGVHVGGEAEDVGILSRSR